ncbi:MAG: tetratricopeptide repeat protein [Daejeonella sp.]
MLRTRLVLVFIFLLFYTTANANFDFNANCIKAYNHIMGLRLNAARTLITAEKNSNPKNSIPYLLDNYVDYFTLFTTETKVDFELFKKNKTVRLNRLEDEDKKSPYYLFAQAEIHLQSALTKARFDEYFSSAIETNKAYDLLEENAKKFPDFLPNQKSIGIINALFGSVPESLKSTLAIVGIRGDTQKGVKMLENAIEKLPSSSYSHFYAESVFYLTSIKIDILNDKKSYESILKYTQNIDNTSLLKTYIRAYAGMKFAHNDDAISTLVNRPFGAEYQSYPYLDYLLGIAKIHNLDVTGSVNLQQYIKNYKGINYIKDAYLNLAWTELLKGNNAGYTSFTGQVKTKGYTYHDKDKQAINEVNYAAPEIDLLKARLLFDGGYYDKALNQLESKKLDKFKLVRDKIEYCYRMGRIYDESGQGDAAIIFYQLAINQGINERYYFASNAALRIGLIYELKKDFAMAKYFYNNALKMKNHDYESSIENKAKTGLKRCSR